MSFPPIIDITTLFSYIILIVEKNRGGAPYMDSMEIRSLCLEVSKAFNISANATKLGKLLLCHRFIKVFNVKLPSCHPTPGVYPNRYLAPYVFIILNARPHRMLLNIFALMSVRVTPQHFLGSDKSPIFGNGTIWPLCHSSKSVSSSQYLLKKSGGLVRLTSLSAFKEFCGTLFSPVALLFVKNFTSAFSSSHYMG